MARLKVDFAQLFSLQSLRKVIQGFFLLLALFLLGLGIHFLFPSLKYIVQHYAKAANDNGYYGVLVFTLTAGLLLLVPGMPGSLLCFTCGAVFPLMTALVVAAVAHHMGACVAFFIARNLFRRRFEDLISSRPKLQAMHKAARVEQWKVTFLSRFIVMPVQLKNYTFGVLPVTFSCFFSMAFLGDLQSTVFSTYLGSVSKQVFLKLDAPHESEDSAVSNVLWIITVITAVTMTTFASLVARRAYKQVLAEVENNSDARKGNVQHSASFDAENMHLLNRKDSSASIELGESGLSPRVSRNASMDSPR